MNLVKCGAPLCPNMVEIGEIEYLKMEAESLLKGGDFAAFVFCPEHNERITNGRVSDNDPNTNPDLNK